MRDRKYLRLVIWTGSEKPPRRDPFRLNHILSLSLSQSTSHVAAVTNNNIYKYILPTSKSHGIPSDPGHRRLLQAVYTRMRTPDRLVLR